MKKTQEIIGLPIISISDGIEVGKVKNVITNAEKGAVDYLVVDSGIQILSTKIIPTVNILGIGEYAVTIENEEAINDLSKIPVAIELLQKNIQVTGTKVLTKKGRLIGEVGDIYVDENDNCNILGLEYIADITHKNIRIIPRTSVITFGKNLVVVVEDVESTLLDKPGDIGTGGYEKEKQKKNLMNYESGSNKDFEENIVKETDKQIAAEGSYLFKEIDTSYHNPQSQPEMIMESAVAVDFPMAQNDEIDYEDSFNSEKDVYRVNDMNFNELESESLGEEVEEVSEDEQMLSEEVEEVLEDEQVLSEDAEEVLNNEESIQESPSLDSNKAKEFNSSNASTGQSGAASLFEQRQKQYLKGRKATKTINSSSGTVIISEGSTITDDVIELSKENGKLIELVMNNKA